ncbi:MAG: dipeptidase [Bacteroidetes Order II. Incertae sedis bacterium]|nr:dipeptidase [Bacteroidetes Order II. bacterium]MBT4053228.1 dipeptidase [Bacteroidetes Order II. bacterium]MBT4602988.1 dipeptidase [Bacteroidetes Order II. bacterium]MBT5248585.1 dipeptidase [Bacteroidetes Order II. bacterium]MBT6200364.1 dipeptidase [Bacteroidetes Order II. bacterium]
MQKALSYTDANFDRFVEELKDFLRIPSVSTDPNHKDDVNAAAEWVAQNMRDMGTSHVKIMPTDGHPIVYAEHMVDPSKPTILVYGHYDVQPPDPLELWDSEPFDPVVKNGDLYARGSCDDKGQMFMHAKAAESYFKGTGSMPLNVKWIFEGEEEIGSVHLPKFLEDNKDMLAADVAVVSDTALFGTGVPSITYGLRGLAYVQVSLEGPDRDLHSGVYGGAIENPINALAKMIADLHDENHRITIDGFYDMVMPLTNEERTTFASLPFDADEWVADVGASESKTEAGYSVLEGTTARPTLDCNGIWGGFTGEGAKTVLPSLAHAKISCRLVPGQTPEEITDKLQAHFEKHCPSTMKLTFEDLHGGHGALVDTNSDAMKAASEAMEGVYNEKPYMVRCGGSIPIVADFKKILGQETVLMGFGLDSDAIHSPNEKFGLDRFRAGIDTIIRFMSIYATK